MSKLQTSFPIDSQKYVTAGVTYDVTIYQRGGSFHAAWHCRHCFTRTETGECVGRASAQQMAEADIRDHHRVAHSSDSRGLPAKQKVNQRKQAEQAGEDAADKQEGITPTAEQRILGDSPADDRSGKQ